MIEAGRLETGGRARALPAAVVLDALDTSYLALGRALEVAPGVRVGDEAGLCWLVTPIPFEGINRVFRVRLSAAEADGRIDELDRRFAATSVHPSWWLDARAAPADLGTRLERIGYVLDENVPAMGMELADLPPLSRVEGVELEFAVDGTAVEVSQRLCATSFGMSSAVADPLVEVMRRACVDASSPIRIVIASVAARPAATALASTVDDIAAVYNVATLPAHRGRGLGRMVTLAVLHDAASRGARLGVLETSDMGHSVYARIGFADAGASRVYVRPTE